MFIFLNIFKKIKLFASLWQPKKCQFNSLELLKSSLNQVDYTTKFHFNSTDSIKCRKYAAVAAAASTWQYYDMSFILSVGIQDLILTSMKCSEHSSFFFFFLWLILLIHITKILSFGSFFILLKWIKGSSISSACLSFPPYLLWLDQLEEVTKIIISCTHRRLAVVVITWLIALFPRRLSDTFYKLINW